MEFGCIWLQIQVDTSLVTRKPVFGVCDLVRLKPVCSATETTQGLEILDIASTGIIRTIQVGNNKGANQTARMRRLICAYVVRIWQNRFSHDVAQILLSRAFFHYAECCTLNTEYLIILF